MKTKTVITTFIWLMLVTSLPAATTLIDYTFGGTDTGPAIQTVWNSNGTGASATTSTGLIDTGSSSSSNIGFNSSTLVDTTSSSGFTATFVIDSITLLTGTVATNLINNGIFFGVVAGPTATDATATGTDGNSLWNKNLISFGYIPGSGTRGDHTAAFNAGDSVTTSGLTTTEPTNASLIDGFTVNLSVFDDNTWTITSSGLSTELDDGGALGDGLTYADFSNVGLYASIQGQAEAELDMGEMTLTAVPEPSGSVLLVLGGLLLLLRRRRA